MGGHKFRRMSREQGPRDMQRVMGMQGAALIKFLEGVVIGIGAVLAVAGAAIGLCIFGYAAFHLFL